MVYSLNFSWRSPPLPQAGLHLDADTITVASVFKVSARLPRRYTLRQRPGKAESYELGITHAHDGRCFAGVGESDRGRGHQAGTTQH
jgi:hypothetical protein